MDQLEKIIDLIRRHEERGILLVTPFLDPRSISELMPAFLNLKASIFGGYEGAERNRIALIPPELEVNTHDYIAVVRIAVPFMKRPLTHIDYLGSILGLGIKRECVGDILVSESMADVIVVPPMAGFIADNLLCVGNCPVRASRIPLNGLTPVKGPCESVTVTVPSLRLDAVTAAMFSISRGRAEKLISQGSVKLNHLPCLDKDHPINDGDKVSAKGFGRAVVSNIGGKSRKGRIFIQIDRYN